VKKTPRIRPRVEVKGKSLADFPDVLAQWHPTKNKSTLIEGNSRSPNYGKVIGPGEIAAGSHKKYWWKCVEGSDHEWEAQVDPRTARNVGCPFCAGQRVCSTNSLSQLFPEISRIWHPTKNGEITPSDIVAGSAKKYWWKCPNGPDHEWEASSRSTTLSFSESSRNGCPFCYGKKVSVTNRFDLKFPDLAKQWHPSLNGDLMPEQVVAHSGKKIWWKCPNGSDHEWCVPVSARTSSGRECPFCANQRVCSTNSLRARFPEICQEWHPSLNGDLTPDDILAYTGKKVWWKCDKGPDHEWEQTPSVRLSMGTGCPFCQNLAVSVTNSLSALFPEIAEQWHPSLNGELLPEQVVAFSGKRVWWKCPVVEGHEWRTAIDKRTSERQGCSICTPGGFQPDLPGSYYVIQIRNGDGEVILYKGGISGDCNRRFMQHATSFSNNERTAQWSLKLVETIDFENGDEAATLERRLLQSIDIRAPSIPNVSRELFLLNPLVYAREQGWT